MRTGVLAIALLLTGCFAHGRTRDPLTNILCGSNQTCRDDMEETPWPSSGCTGCAAVADGVDNWQQRALVYFTDPILYASTQSANGH